MLPLSIYDLVFNPFFKKNKYIDTTTKSIQSLQRLLLDHSRCYNLLPPQQYLLPPQTLEQNSLTYGTQVCDTTTWPSFSPQSGETTCATPFNACHYYDTFGPYYYPGNVIF